MLAPASAKAGTAELMACLTLVAPSGMTTEDRQAWAAVARQTLSGIPADLLKRGCDKARKTCRFASDIVPTIMADVEREWTRRKRVFAEEMRANTPKLAKPEYVGVDEVRNLIKKLSSQVLA